MRLEEVFMKATLLIMLLFAAHGIDWRGCANSLDELRQKSENASDASRSVEKAQEEVSDAKNALLLCNGFGEDCKIKEDELEEAQGNYGRKLDESESEFRSVVSAVNSASTSCGFELGSPRVLN
jgi:hypothetical protein